MNKILYLSLTGMTEALGESQVVAYLKPLSKNNKIFLISFEKGSIDNLPKNLETLGIEWHPMQYSNKYGSISAFIMVAKAIFLGLYITWRAKVNIVHARSMIPAMMGYWICFFSKAKLLFDIRDFSTDEKVDRGRIEKNSILYKILLAIEIYLYKKSDHIVALTKVSKELLIENFLIKRHKISVIPTCADASVFYVISDEKKMRVRESLGFSLDDFICIHVGTVTGWYLFDEELVFFKKIQEIKENAKLLILNQGQHEYVNTKLKEYNISEASVKVLDVKYGEVNRYINIADVSLYFITPSYSKKAAAPTKYAEFVCVNLPSITNSGIGDMDYYINRFNTGVIADPFNITIESVRRSLLRIEDLSARPMYKELYESKFSIKVAVAQYQNIYDELAI